jgi:hypothetical protein
MTPFLDYFIDDDTPLIFSPPFSPLAADIILLPMLS